jgi:CDP-diacylglycerol--serine O-phosphatidyltransferase
MVRKHIPNFITCLNLLSGCIGISLAFDGNLELASILIGLSALFDFMDGMVARVLHVKSEIGKQLDSLADVISFGLLPGVIMFHLMKQSTLLSGDASNIFSFFPYLAFLIPVFSALRLAKFNIDPRQSESFIGLPTPAVAIFIGSFPLIMKQISNSGRLEIISGWLNNYYILAAIALLLSGLLVAEIPLFSLKFKNMVWKENKAQFILLFLSLIALIILGFVALPLIIIIYILLSFVFKQNGYNT